jgi:acyl carrier protein
MLALEDAFDIEFPDELLTKHTFSTLSTIRDAVAGLHGAPEHTAPMKGAAS